MSEITKIVITFPEPIELDNAACRRLDRFVNSLCEAWEKKNPDKVMWPFGQGFAMKVNPMMLADDEPIPFDETMYHVECSARESSPEEQRVSRHYARFSNPNEMYEDLRDFHVKFGLKYNGPPRPLPSDLSSFRSKFMDEELQEYLNAVTITKDLEKQLDALVDLVYVALGTAYMHGFDFNEAWRRVHTANMKKVRSARKGNGSERGGEFDVVKPPDWTAPDLSDLARCSECKTPELCTQDNHCDRLPNGYR